MVVGECTGQISEKSLSLRPCLLWHTLAHTKSKFGEDDINPQ